MKRKFPILDFCCDAPYRATGNVLEGEPRGDHDVAYETATRSKPAWGYVRTLPQQELPLLRDHLVRLDAESRHDRFNGFLDDSFIESYAARCADDGTMIIAYIENGVVRGAAEQRSVWLPWQRRLKIPSATCSWLRRI
jgi:hypothetical protein